MVGTGAFTAYNGPRARDFPNLVQTLRHNFPVEDYGIIIIIDPPDQTRCHKINSRQNVCRISDI